MSPALARRLTAPLRRWHAELRLSILERRLRQDPHDLERRIAAAALYCRRAAADAEEPELLDRARGHLEFILGATGDIHRLHGVLSHAVGPAMFYRLPELTARYMRKIGLDRECLEEFDTRSEFEERATPYHLANALAVLKAAGRRGAAQTLFEEAVGLEWRGQRPVRWKRLEQTPAVYIDGLEHRPFWDGAWRPSLADHLEAHWSEILEDLEGVCRRRRRATGQVPAYPNLVDGSGVWDMLQLYSGRRWHEDACALAPRTSALLRNHLPTTEVPYIHYNTEEVVVFLLAPGSRVRLHNGGSNAPINVALGLSGCNDSYIEVAGEARPVREGSVTCFDDGSDHRVWNDGAEPRWVLTVRTMHPQLASDPGQFFSRAFTRRTCFESWDEERSFKLCGHRFPEATAPNAASHGG
mmetsp:Transcript_49676/g.144059  ORF Transcript_49676/g.144059 Transcript_49676/m.144059 type:complete len:412 (-) Transcript_49676:374-1609(-)